MASIDEKWNRWLGRMNSVFRDARLLEKDRTRPGRPDPALNEPWIQWGRRVSKVIAEGAAVAEEAEPTGVQPGGHAALATLMYDQICQRHIEAELETLLVGELDDVSAAERGERLYVRLARNGRQQSGRRIKYQSSWDLRADVVPGQLGTVVASADFTVRVEWDDGTFSELDQLAGDRWCGVPPWRDPKNPKYMRSWPKGV